MEFQEYIKPELLVLVPVLYIIGMIMKQTEKVDDRIIPAVLGGIGIVFSMIWVIGTEGFGLLSIFSSLTQGVLVAGAAVYVNQVYKQARKDE